MGGGGVGLLYVSACETVRLMNESIGDIGAGASACGHGDVTGRGGGNTNRRVKFRPSVSSASRCLKVS